METILVFKVSVLYLQQNLTIKFGGAQNEVLQIKTDWTL